MLSLTCEPLIVETQLILKFAEILFVLAVAGIVPDKVTVWLPENALCPENTVGFAVSEATHEDTFVPAHCKFTFEVKLTPAPFGVAPFPTVKKIFNGPSEPLALMSIGFVEQLCVTTGLLVGVEQLFKSVVIRVCLLPVQILHEPICQLEVHFGAAEPVSCAIRS